MLWLHPDCNSCTFWGRSSVLNCVEKDNNVRKYNQNSIIIPKNWKEANKLVSSQIQWPLSNCTPIKEIQSNAPGDMQHPWWKNAKVNGTKCRRKFGKILRIVGVKTEENITRREYHIKC